MRSESHSAGEFPLAQRAWSFHSIQAFNRLVKPTHIKEGSLLYPESTNLNVNLIHKHLPS